MISLSKLKERKLVQWALAYLAGAWLVLQLASLLSGAYAWGPLVMRVLPVVLVFGFFATLVLAWYHGERGEQRVGTVELGMLTALLVIAGAAVAIAGGGTEPRPATAATAEARPASEPVAEQGSIAVLPFVNMSADDANEYFSDGLSEELLNALAQLPELRVAARTSAFAFEDKDVGIDSIARALNVRHVLEGSVRKAGDQVRITAQLIDAETGYHLWSETYDRELADIFAVQDEISRAIVEALQLELGGGREGARLVERETTVPEAHTLVLRGEYAANQSTRESMARAMRYFEQALALDPDYARAHAGLAASVWYQAYREWIPPEEGYTKAEPEAERALALDPDLAVAHLVLAQVAADRDWDWDAAVAHYDRALEANPGYARAYDWRGLLLVQLGRTEEAIASGRRAVALDPVSSGRIQNLGYIYLFAGQPERALEQFRAAQALDPGYPQTLYGFAWTYSEMGRHAEALEAAERLMEAMPDRREGLSLLGAIQAHAGNRAAAERTLAELEALPEASPYDLARIYAELGGESDRVFALLERAVEEREVSVTSLGVDPDFDAYRDDPRMRQLLDRMGLP